ncbi:putative DNA topoisomerase 1 [Mollisia scopiformis]|uniref:DNA topoisomerase I n=1 Tax=Mollisia scopiformis TaxID=149040 RepID=A0A194XRD5_MOLSC|nr:putative DNA topoisomerase 1 [Mollisia scopiformis]KUJ22287.1 putative DNA topoisomerase 1 [Mollisia scopiformis]
MASDSSDDDMPLAKSNGRVSEAHISKATDKKMDQAGSSKSNLPAGISIRNGPVIDDEMDVDAPTTNGHAKRKSRTSTSKAVKYHDDTDESDDEPLAKRQRTTQKPADSDSDDEPLATKKKPGKLPPKASETAIGDSSDDDDEPLTAKLAKTKASIEKKAEKEAKAIRAKESKAKKAAPKKAKKEDSDSEEEVKPKAKRKSNGTATKRANGVKKEESDSDAPLAKKATAKKANGKVKAEPAGTPTKKGKGKKEDSVEEEDEVYRWWDAPKKEDDSVKWDTLQHNGVVFPPEYEPLPKNVKLLYDGVPLTLSIEAEEIAGFFGAMLSSTLNVENLTFQKNFFEDFTAEVKKTGGARDPDGNKVAIKEFSKLDFKPIFAYYDGKVQERKARSSAEKKADKAAKDAIEAPYTTCIWDGRKEQVGNFRVEPPGLFRGRGAHPKTGKVKRRVTPEQITINIGKDATVPAAPEGHKWKAIQHDNKATWLAMWQENINGAYKYVMLAAKSSIKGQSDFKKFEKARELKKHIDRIRKDYTRDLRAELMADRQRATAVYLIDKFALRAGNEKDAENEAETVGCCSLKFEHVTLKPPNTVIFDFLGKDSIRFYDEVVVDEQVFKNLKIFKKAPKKEGDDIFDRLNTTQLNKHLTNYMPGLSAKVFRTYNASFTMSTLLKELQNTNISLQEKVKLYNDCNRKVAILCNHKRTVGASHEAAMEKMTDRIKGLQYQQWRIKQMILDIEPKQKKKKGANWFELDDDLDEAWILEHQAFLVKQEREKIEKKFAKENEKLVTEGQKEMKTKELTERLGVADDLEKKFKKENKTKKIEADGKGPTVEKLEANIKKLDERIATMRLQAEDREGNKEVALGTSKINYIDPRLTVVFAKKFNVPIEKFFSKTLRDKFTWAIESIEDEDDWEF